MQYKIVYIDYRSNYLFQRQAPALQLFFYLFFSYLVYWERRLISIISVNTAHIYLCVYSSLYTNELCVMHLCVSVCACLR